MVEENNDNAQKMMDWFILRINYRAVLLSHKLEEIGARKDKTEEEQKQTQQLKDECRLEMLYLKGRADAVWKNKTIEELKALKDEWGNELLVKFIDDIIEEKTKGKSKPSTNQTLGLVSNSSPTRIRGSIKKVKVWLVNISIGLAIIAFIALVYGINKLSNWVWDNQSWVFELGGGILLAFIGFAVFQYGSEFRGKKGWTFFFFLLISISLVSYGIYYIVMALSGFF